tara:strand:- start:519 stop:860 length:342 start_codon:yes stop_codon:yes gene_type:complete
MKHILYTLTISALMLSGCGSSNKVDSQSAEETQANMESTYVIGQVYMEKDGCEIFILTEGKEQEKLYPVGLDDMFRVNEAILQFEYDLSRAPLPEGCEDCRAVVLRSVTRVKR